MTASHVNINVSRMNGNEYVIPEPLKARLAAAVLKEGRALPGKLDISEGTLARALAGMTVKPTTGRRIEQALRWWEEDTAKGLPT